MDAYGYTFGDIVRYIHGIYDAVIDLWRRAPSTEERLTRIEEELAYVRSRLDELCADAKGGGSSSGGSSTASPPEPEAQASSGSVHSITTSSMVPATAPAKTRDGGDLTARIAELRDDQDRGKPIRVACVVYGRSAPGHVAGNAVRDVLTRDMARDFDRRDSWYHDDTIIYRTRGAWSVYYVPFTVESRWSAASLLQRRAPLLVQDDRKRSVIVYPSASGDEVEAVTHHVELYARPDEDINKIRVDVEFFRALSTHLFRHGFLVLTPLYIYRSEDDGAESESLTVDVRHVGDENQLDADMVGVFDVKDVKPIAAKLLSDGISVVPASALA